MIIHKIKKSLMLKPYFWVIINLVLAPRVYAGDLQGDVACDSSEICNPLKASSFSELIADITNIAMAIGFPVAVMFIIYSGFLFVTARGSEDKITKAKSTFMWAILGTAVLLGAAVIAKAVQGTVSSLGN